MDELLDDSSLQPEGAVRLVLGTMSFGDTVDEPTAGRIIEAAIEAGITELDTANTYAGGASEQIIGRVLRSAPEGIAVSSKVGMQPGRGAGPLAHGEVIAAARTSVERLGRPLDTLYLHQPDRSTPLTETVGGVSEVLELGLADRFGLSNHSAWETVEVHELCRRQQVAVPRRAQQLYNALARRLEVEFLPFAAARGVQTVVYNPLAGGLLTGRHTIAEEPADGRFGSSALAPMYRQRYWTQERFQVLDELRAIADGAALTLIELALRWLLGVPGVGAILVGGSTPEQIRSNVAALGRGPLEAELRVRIDAATAPLLAGAPHYAR
ncbi:aldo/keto reductase [Occultella aeris]|uniref:L-glyceraldehyde 3-phosphate reductase n=1 Tax=Occultella aeris TaxID=2761496 RepID=A0A7M4DHW8_9MICO|nr:aldo/keto reductase [Occultella aeris]VZO36515.1 L-glyceraldehyde 3-phosphate reductase [Occultella aeris]